MKMKIVICGMAMASVSGAATAQQTLFEQLPAGVDIFANDASGSISTARTADNFSFSTQVQVTSVQWWGSYVPLNISDPTSLDDFTITFFANGSYSDDDVPGDVLFEQRVSVTAVDTGVDISGVIDQYLYTAVLDTPLVFDANQQYWFMALNDTGLDDLFPDAPNASWGWERTTLDPTNYWARLNTNDPLPWTQRDDPQMNLAFRLNGSVVPTPSAAAAFGVAGLLGLRRRR